MSVHCEKTIVEKKLVIEAHMDHFFPHVEFKSAHARPCKEVDQVAQKETERPLCAKPAAYY
jgi:hypothetical protein